MIRDRKKPTLGRKKKSSGFITIGTLLILSGNALNLRAGSRVARR